MNAMNTTFNQILHNPKPPYSKDPIIYSSSNIKSKLDSNICPAIDFSKATGKITEFPAFCSKKMVAQYVQDDILLSTIKRIRIYIQRTPSAKALRKPTVLVFTVYGVLTPVLFRILGPLPAAGATPPLGLLKLGRCVGCRRWGQANGRARARCCVRGRAVESRARVARRGRGCATTLSACFSLWGAAALKHPQKQQQPP
ncbi:hypothetical protein HYPSUDRAFT_56028 [Hypholoma sublateritium FD-334 SS-4]|uniref:Uncharacterized protein n=1 Tax=Hypholoma sublateritium (strain FD-334 SS-4) TaxID=945553 RepID=A0A0D2PKX5_HYPSF|nr:hypothetical protein HYPSUDRAFT_56028 [Hypholoma sublateritium FD-334 SS-4]